MFEVTALLIHVLAESDHTDKLIGQELLLLFDPPAKVTDEADLVPDGRPVPIQTDGAGSLRLFVDAKSIRHAREPRIFEVPEERPGHYYYESTEYIALHTRSAFLMIPPLGFTPGWKIYVYGRGTKAQKTYRGEYATPDDSRGTYRIREIHFEDGENHCKLKYSVTKDPDTVQEELASPGDTIPPSVSRKLLARHLNEELHDVIIRSPELGRHLLVGAMSELVISALRKVFFGF